MLALNSDEELELKFLFTVNGSVHNTINNFYSISSVSMPNIGDVPIFTTSENHGFLITDKVSVSGINPSSFNFCKKDLISVTNNTFSVDLNPSEFYTSGGIASVDDIYISIIRGEYGDGPVVDGRFAYLSQDVENNN